MTANHDIYSRRSLKRGTPNNDDAVPVVEAAYVSVAPLLFPFQALRCRSSVPHCSATLSSHYSDSTAASRSLQGEPRGKIVYDGHPHPCPNRHRPPRLPDPRIPAPNRMANFVEVPSEPKAEEMTQTCNEGVKRRHGTSDSSVNIAPLEMIEGATESQRQGEGAREVSAKCHQTQK